MPETNINIANLNRGKQNDFSDVYNDIKLGSTGQHSTRQYAERKVLHVPRHRLSTFSRRAYAIVGPSTWNSVPDTVRNPNPTKAAFRCLLNKFFGRY